MKKRLTLLMALFFLGLAPTVWADMELYVAEDTISVEQAHAIAQILAEALDIEVTLARQEETKKSFDERMLSGDVPQLAILKAHQARFWAEEGGLLSLDGMVTVEQMESEAVEVCTAGDALVLAPLFVRRRMMAVNTAQFEAAQIGYLLDERAHPVWYPSQFVQALDELALLGRPGMDLWKQEASSQGVTATEALLQSVSGVCLADVPANVSPEEALVFLDDMVRAGLIGSTKSREEALERFLAGETAIFVDWTQEDTLHCGETADEQRIELRPYPASDGAPRYAWDLIGVCAVKGTEDEALLRRAVSLLVSDARAVRIYGSRMLAQDGTFWLPAADSLEGGATLRALFLRAAGDILAGEADPREAAGYIMRSMDALTN